MRCLIRILIILSLIPSSAFAYSTTTQTFQASNTESILNQTQVSSSGQGTRLSLLFGFTPLTVGNYSGSLSQVKMVYDNINNDVIMFGGASALSAGNYINQTYKFDLVNGWAPVNPATSPNSPGSPQGRAYHGMAPTGDGRIIMFGGIDNLQNYLNDMWVFNNIAQSPNWIQLVPLSSTPSARSDFVMASDTTTQKVLLFGGRASDSTTLLADTWIYDINHDSWTQCVTLSSPTARTGAAMTFDPADGYFYLFGGNDGSAVKSDMWKFSISQGSWVLVSQTSNPPSPPVARQYAGMCYDTRYSKIVMWGGVDSLSHIVENDGRIWNFDTSGGTWYEGIPASTPVARSAFGMSYISSIDEILIFGGQPATGSPLNDTNFYVYRATGNYTSSRLDAGSNTSSTPFKWLSLNNISYTPDVPVQTTIKFQVASSSDDVTYSQFTGIDGTSTSFYGTLPGNLLPYDISASSCTGRYLKYKIYIQSGGDTSPVPPLTPYINSMSLSYNYAPSAPLLTDPLNGSDTNYIYPQFSWNNAQDYDVHGDTLTYQIQVDLSYNFTSPIISTAGITGLSYTATSASTALGFGTWYWRVRAYDGSTNGAWSSTYTLYVDTIAPNAITTLSANSGAINGQIQLSWVNPIDQTPAPAYIQPNYYYQVVYSSAGAVISTSTFSMAQYGTVSSSSGTLQTINVNNLGTATTYYFAVFLEDLAGNYSAISTPTSVFACTNSSPTIQLSALAPSTTWATGIQVINWSASDPDIGDTLTYTISASSDSGVSYSITITSGLTNGTTSYSWNTETVPNGQYMIRVKTQDARGLYALSATPSAFTVYNQNYAPSVTIVSPLNNAVSSGTITVLWSASDLNLSDTHTYNVYISSISGLNYTNILSSATQSSYTLNTKLYPNSQNYIIKVVATDSGTPPLSGGATVAFSIGNNNLPPNTFSLVSPANGSSKSPLGLVFTWQNNGAPNPIDSLSYTLYFSTNLSFNPAVTVGPINTNSFQLNSNILQQEAQYYWKVTAQGPLGLVTYSNNGLAWSVVLTRSQADSSDGRVHVQITDGLPSNGYIIVSKYNASGDRSIAAANVDVLADRNIKTIGDDVYKISICDVNGNILSAPAKNKPGEATSSGALNINALIAYVDQNNSGYFNNTLVPAANLRGAMLNETAGKWELVPKTPVISTANKTIAMSLNQTGLLTLVGALIPATKISSLTNYPNPFKAGSETTRIRYVLTENMDISASIYTLTGNLVYQKTYSQGSTGGQGQPTGYTNEIQWDGTNGNGELVANGMYILDIRSGSEKQERKIGVVK